MIRPWQTWVLFVACLAVVLAALGWVSLSVLRLEREQAEIRRRAALEENIRLALWRMDSAVSTLIARESARPYFTYASFYPAERAYTRMFAELKRGDVLIPSPLLTYRNPYILLHFQYGSDGAGTSPQVPAGSMRGLVKSAFLTGKEIDVAAGRLAALRNRIGKADLAGMLPLEEPKRAVPAQQFANRQVTILNDNNDRLLLNNASGSFAGLQQGNYYATNAGAQIQDTQGNPTVVFKQDLRNTVEWKLRQQRQTEDQWVARGQNDSSSFSYKSKGKGPARGNRKKTAEGPVPSQAEGPVPSRAEGPAPKQLAGPAARQLALPAGKPGMPSHALVSNGRVEIPSGPPPDVKAGAMRPLMVGGALLLARRVRVDGAEYVQGCQLDWPAVRTWLLGQITDLFEKPNLHRVRPGDADGKPRMLASLPVRLVPGPMPPLPDGGLSALRLSLIAAWGCALVAVVAVAGLLSGAVRLSERRASFVSAVTHELRTPLTTFRMYAEMLAEGMVDDPRERREYLTTLRTEADRLGHLVENVLSYARLERGSARSRVETLAVGGLLEQAGRRLAEHAERSDMKLAVEVPEPVARQTVRADAGAVEQILFNLVDNACKYAASAADRRIHLGAAARNGSIALCVSDHGPGVAGSETRRLFRPFRKSARDAASSAPGVGLGLALSRRLARRMGGDLRIDASGAEGAAFVLTLPQS